jgi:DNA-binding HxlR family transcriptional regulator
MAKPGYNQYCGVARAAEVLGERWNLLIVRDLLIGPERYGELLAGLPGLSSNVLASRLRDLEARGVVRRRLLPRPASGTVYELTEYGHDLEDILSGMAAWGARSLGERTEGQGGRPVVASLQLRRALSHLVTTDDTPGAPSIVVVDYGSEAVTFTCAAESCTTTWGRAPDPDVVLTTRPDVVTSILGGHLAPHQAAAEGRLAITGRAELAARVIDRLTTHATAS